MTTLITGTFEDDRQVQAAVEDLADAGIPATAVRVITPPAAEPAQGERDEGEGAGDQADGLSGAMAGLAAMGLAMGGTGGAAAGGGYPPAAVGAGVVAGAILNEAFGELRDLALEEPERRLYRQRLQDGATVLAVRADAEHRDAVAEVLARHHGSDIHGG